MSDFLKFDPRGLPKNFNRIDYYNAVKAELVGNYEVSAGDTITIGAVVGLLLLGEYFDHKSPAFEGAVRVAREEMLKKVPAFDTSQLFGGDSTELAERLKPYSTAQVAQAMKTVPRAVFEKALTKMSREKIGLLIGGLLRGELDTILEKLPDPNETKRLKGAALKDFPQQFIHTPRDQVDEMLKKVTEDEFREVMKKSSRNEVFAVLEKFPASETVKVLQNLGVEDTNRVSSKKVYEKIHDIVVNSGRKELFFQEFATVGRYVISRADEIPFGHPRFDRQVEIGLNQYVSGTPVFDSLDLPPLQGDNGQDNEIIPDNIKAVSMVYATYQLDVGMRMIDVVDRVNEIFHNGQLPIGFDAGGRAIDEYNWTAEDRMNPLARRMHYSRVLGMAGGDVSREVSPNTQFESLFMRFLSSLAEYDRQQRVADIVARSRPQNLTSEYVRKSGRDLAANLSLYGWAATHFAARRLRQHIESALSILKQPSVQKAYGVTNLYQVIERVSALEFNSTPNIVKHRTMAEAGKEIIDLIAKYHYVWNKSDGVPLFSESIGGETFGGDISDEDRNRFLSLTQQWLAVNGIKDAQVDHYSEPEIAAYAPSIPSFGGYGGGSAPKTNGSGNTDQMERIKQMVTQGQMPSLDQLQGMFKM